jgi:hypothetical protein
LIVDDDYVAENDAQILAVEVEDAEEEEVGEMSLLHLDHMANHTPQTIRFQGEIQGVPVLVLVDSGATHNFISQIGEQNGLGGGKRFSHANQVG